MSFCVITISFAHLPGFEGKLNPHRAILGGSLTVNDVENTPALVLG
jgi:hypothetical protein